MGGGEGWAMGDADTKGVRARAPIMGMDGEGTGERLKGAMIGDG